MKRSLALLLLAATPLAADQVFLKGGGQLTGVVIERSASSIVIEVAPGRLTIPASRVERVVEGSSALLTFQTRAAAIAAGDATAWVDLGDWALERGMQTQARNAFQRAVSIDPDNAAAHRGLGETFVDGRWLGDADAHRARGLVQFRGEWVTPSERDAEMRQQEAEAAAMAARAEAAARVREADARAAAAEADARRAEVEPFAYGDTYGGIPYSWVLAGGGCGYGYGCGHHVGRPAERPVVTPPQAPPPTPSRPPVERPAPRSAPTSAGAVRTRTPH